MTRATDIEQRASEWIIRSEAGHFTEDMRAELERWLQDPRNRVIYIRIKEAWRRAGRLRSNRPLDGNVDPDLLKDPNPSFEPSAGRSRPRWPLRVAAGAAVTLIIYLGAVLLWSVLGPSRWIPYTTSIGGYENVTLADGSSIQLNTDTEIRARITAQQREIQLVRGEALIKVTHDVTRPFTVHANGAALRVDPPGDTGAAFSLRLRAPAGMDVAVTRGNVLLGSPERIIDVALGRSPSAQSALQAGDVASVRPQGIHVAKVSAEELNRKLSWTIGLLSFQGETLTEVTDEFNRYNRKHLVVVDPSIAGRRIGGAFQSTDPDSFVSALQKWFGVHADELRAPDPDDAIIRLSKAN
jgi:transmembrane sensor